MSDKAMKIKRIIIANAGEYGADLELSMEKANELQAVLNNLLGNPFYPVPYEVPVYPTTPCPYEIPPVTCKTPSVQFTEDLARTVSNTIDTAEPEDIQF